MALVVSIFLPFMQKTGYTFCGKGFNSLMQVPHDAYRDLILVLSAARTVLSIKAVLYLPRTVYRNNSDQDPTKSVFIC